MSKEREALQKILNSATPRSDNELFTWYATIRHLATEALQSESEWISVEDRLPESNGHYLIWDYGNDIALFHYGKWKTTDKQERGVLSDLRATINPTHWMYLPQEPSIKTPKI